MGADITKMAVPTFFLEPRSLLEKYTDIMAHPQLLIGIGEEEDAVQRMLTVVRWYMSGWHLYPKNCKKPYNPVLGEQFVAFWDHGDSRTDYYSEQVSHHPPISAFYMENRKRHIVINGSFRCISTMSGNTATTEFNGAVYVHILNHNEEYVLTFPSFSINGLLIGHMYMQLTGSCTISCARTGLHAFIQFQPKRWCGADVNRIRGSIHRGTTIHDPCLYRFDGKWDSRIDITDANGSRDALFDANATPLVRKTVAPIESQSSIESRRVWEEVSSWLKKLDHERASAAKHKLEDRQRRDARARDASRIVYQPSLFVAVPRPQHPNNSSTSSRSPKSATSVPPPSLSSLYQVMKEQSNASDSIPSSSSSRPTDPIWIYSKMNLRPWHRDEKLGPAPGQIGEWKDDDTRPIGVDDDDDDTTSTGMNTGTATSRNNSRHDYHGRHDYEDDALPNDELLIGATATTPLSLRRPPPLSVNHSSGGSSGHTVNGMTPILRSQHASLTPTRSYASSSQASPLSATVAAIAMKPPTSARSTSSDSSSQLQPQQSPPPPPPPPVIHRSNLTQSLLAAHPSPVVTSTSTTSAMATAISMSTIDHRPLPPTIHSVILSSSPSPAVPSTTPPKVVLTAAEIREAEAVERRRQQQRADDEWRRQLEERERAAMAALADDPSLGDDNDTTTTTNNEGDDTERNITDDGNSSP